MLASSFRIFLLLCGAFIMSCGHKAPLFIPPTTPEEITEPHESVEESTSTDIPDNENKNTKDRS